MARWRRVAVTAVALTAIGLPLGAAPVAGRTPDLTLVTRATYDVLPDEGRVAVTVRISARNRLHDTVARRFYFRTAFLTVPPGASGFRISASTGTPKVSVKRRAADHILLRIDLGVALAARRSRNLTLRFDIADRGGAPDRPVRIMPTLATFQAWAFATPETRGSTVTVTLPADYEITVSGGPLDGPSVTGDGRKAWSSGALDAPLEFVADVTAERPTDPSESRRTVALGDAGGTADVVLRAWPDDPGWRDRVGDLIAGALPVMRRGIGLPWALQDPLVVEESLVASGTPGASVFDPASGRLRLAYSATDAVVLEQLGHVWFNGRLVADRWLADAFALLYAEWAADALGVEGAPPVLTPELEAVAVPLNAWIPAGLDGSSGSPEADAYARAAGLALAAAVAERASPDALAATWIDAAAGLGAYQPPGGDEAAPGTLDWRSLLDLLEDRSGRSFDDLWGTWVARPADLVALDARRLAREHYAATVARADGWLLPRTVREAMRAWRFDVAEQLLSGADRVLTARAALEAEAASLGLVLPDRLQRMFEGEDGFEVVEAEAEAQRAAVAAIGEARDARPEAADDLAVTVGLIGVDPDAQLARAAEALAGGDIEAAFETAASAEDVWLGAATVGRNRIVSVGLLVAALIGLVGLIGWRRRGGARARP
jgi:hypothetical protein